MSIRLSDRDLAHFAAGDTNLVNVDNIRALAHELVARRAADLTLIDFSALAWVGGFLDGAKPDAEPHTVPGQAKAAIAKVLKGRVQP